MQQIKGLDSKKNKPFSKKTPKNKKIKNIQRERFPIQEFLEISF